MDVQMDQKITLVSVHKEVSSFPTLICHVRKICSYKRRKREIILVLSTRVKNKTSELDRSNMLTRGIWCRRESGGQEAPRRQPVSRYKSNTPPCGS